MSRNLSGGLQEQKSHIDVVTFLFKKEKIEKV